MKKLLMLFILLITFCFIYPCFAELQCLIKVPATEKIKKDTITISDKVKEKFKKTRSQVTDDLLWNTKVYKNEKLINFVTQMTLSEFEQYIKNEKLKWTILAANKGTKQIEIDKEIKIVTNTLIYYDYNEVINFVREEDPVEVELGKFAGMRPFEPQK